MQTGLDKLFRKYLASQSKRLSDKSRRMLSYVAISAAVVSATGCRVGFVTVFQTAGTNEIKEVLA